jgi:uncharacterized protein (TIRG00374 family)
MKDVRPRIVMVVGLIFSAIALWLVLRTIDLGEVLNVVGTADPVPLLAVVGVVAIQVTLRAFRWSILLPRRETGQRVAVPRLIPPLLIGYLGNAILPARLGEPMRAVIAARRERIGLSEAFGSVLLERVVDVATLAPVAFLAALVVGAPEWALQVLGLTAGGGLFILLVLIAVGVGPFLRLADRLGLGSRPRIRDLASRFTANLHGPDRRRVLLTVAGISAAAWLFEAMSFWLAATAVRVDLDYPAAMLIAGITVLGTAIPSAPGYLGTYELAAAGTATLLGVHPAAALALALLVHVMTLAPLALGGALSVVALGASFTEVAREAEASGHE